MFFFNATLLYYLYYDMHIYIVCSIFSLPDFLQCFKCGKVHVEAPLGCLCKHKGNSSLFPTQTNSVEFPQMRDSRLLLA